MQKILKPILILCLLSEMVYSKTVEYVLAIKEQAIDITGKTVTGLTINDSVPGPTLFAHEGDWLKITVKNFMKQETVLHWHGVLVPNEMDGVPYITTPPIKPGNTFVYEFPVKQSGTYWYHAHSGLQEQQGLYGAMILYPKQHHNIHPEQAIVLSDWSNEKPENILKNIKKYPEYYALRKNSVQSWYDVLKNGTKAISIRLKNTLDRMGPMDISDVFYDAFLMNGKRQLELGEYPIKKPIRLRLINAGASTHFRVVYSGGNMQVIEADGMEVKPFFVSELRMAMGETYDVMITLPESKRYELRASAEDGSGFSVAHLGAGELVPAAVYQRPNLLLMDHHGHHHPVNSIYKELASVKDTRLPQQNLTREIDLRLTGNMERYIWTINHQPMYAADSIIVKKGENIRFNLINETMMDHPIHLHGHFFRILNGQDNRSPLKHTVNVSPFETVSIEFEADQEKDWIFHCHNLYHMKLGMGGVISYKKDSINTKKHSKNHSGEHGNIWFYKGDLHALSNFSEAHITWMNQDNYFGVEAQLNYWDTSELEVYYKRYLTQFLGLYGGIDFTHGAMLGGVYTLPLFIESDFRIASDGAWRLQLSSEHALTDRLSFEWKINHQLFYRVGFNFQMTQNLFASLVYDSKELIGAGILVSF